MSDFYCPRIANGIAFTPNRDYDVCGVRDLNGSSQLSIFTTSPSQFRESNYVNELQETMSRGQWPRGCEHCRWVEHVGLTSVRQSVLSFEKKLVHINSSNICDSDCVMCGPRWSTTIANRLAKHPDPTRSFFTLGNEGNDPWTDDKSYAHMVDACREADEINIVGGEPFLDKRIWKMLDAAASPNQTLKFVTNGNTFPNESQIEIIRKYRQLKLTFSIDATGLTYEWIRQGLSWRTVMHNLLLAMKLPNTQVSVSAVVQAHNVLDLSRLYQTFESSRIRVSFEPLVHPAMLSARNAPSWALEQAISDIPANSPLQAFLMNCLSQGPLVSLDEMLAHTSYLNGHRTHHFDVETWTVQSRT